MTTTHSATAAANKSNLIARRLYRNLLRASEPFTAPSPNAAVLTCLLHRTGIDDHIRDWNAFVSRDADHRERASGTLGPGPPKNRTYQRLFRRLLREVVTGTNGYGKMVFPSQADTQRLRAVLQREFRAPSGVPEHDGAPGGGRAQEHVNDAPATEAAAAASVHFDPVTRKQVAFAALRELNKKLSYHDWLASNSPEPVLPQQAACFVSPLPTHRPSSYLRPGVFLVSHPFMQDSYFSKAVICILEHKGIGDTSDSNEDGIVDDSGDDSGDDNGDDNDTDNDARRRARRASTVRTPAGQTYGVVVNRVSVHPETGSNRTLKEVFREHMLPERLADAFGDAVVREGGPVHVALQMVHSVPSDHPELAEAVGGTILPSVCDSDSDGYGYEEETEHGDDEDNNHRDRRALHSDKATYFRGNMFKVMSQIEKGKMDRDDVSFFVGASIWSPGQLAAEIAQGYWIPCRGPPDMALDGICEHEQPFVPSSTSSSPSSSSSSSPLEQPGFPETTTKIHAKQNANHKRPLADLWLSMMSACGTDEARLSHLFHRDHWDENGMPCDAFDDDDDDIVIF
mmetsp:Transcript_157/g.307  ORF Transcript_157/g.307 Transcript_157/m.307 type:complete len:569 (+) Transcript_157:399-2105(+)